MFSVLSCGSSFWRVTHSMIRLFLGLVGSLYLGLAIWCAVRPASTSAKVGFALVGDAGRSEFLTVYGGLEFGLGLIFLWPLVRSSHTSAMLLACLLIHGSLVVFRSVSLALYHDVPSMTLYLAGAEWLIFLCSAGLWWTSKSPAV